MHAGGRRAGLATGGVRKVLTPRRQRGQRLLSAGRRSGDDLELGSGKLRLEPRVVLKPGEPAYANVRVALGGAHEDNKVVKSFNLNLFAPEGPAEGSIVVNAPAGGLAVDEAAAKTGYWTY